MPGEEVLLLVFDVGGVVQGVVHIPVAVGVRDALDGPCSRFPQGNSGIVPWTIRTKRSFWPCSWAACSFSRLSMRALQPPDDKAHDRARNTHSRDKGKHHLAR